MVTKNAILIFDGDCGFCTTTANWIVKHSKTQVTAVPWQRTDVTQYGLLEPQVMDKVYVVINGRPSGGNEAVAELLKIQNNKFLWFLGWVSLLPPFCLIGSGVYRLVAKYRHKLPGGTPACKLP